MPAPRRGPARAAFAAGAASAAAAAAPAAAAAAGTTAAPSSRRVLASPFAGGAFVVAGAVLPVRRTRYACRTLHVRNRRVRASAAAGNSERGSGEVDGDGEGDGSAEDGMSGRPGSSSSSSSSSGDAVEYFGGGASMATPLFGSETAPSTVPALGSFAELPLFPLPLVLNPGSSLPLHIFEMRYRLMFNRVRDSDSRFGIVFYDREKDAIAAVGCSAELTRFEPLPDGRIMTNNVGRDRFRVVNIIEEKPYRRALVEYFRDDSPENGEVAELSKLEADVWTALQDVLRLSNKLYDKSLDLGANIKDLAPSKMQSNASSTTDVHQAAVTDGSNEPVSPESSASAAASEATRTQDFSFAVSQVLDMPVSEQQILLQTRKTSARLRKQCRMLETARQYLAAQVVIKEAGLKF